jgi:hypothetical protein
LVTPGVIRYNAAPTELRMGAVAVVESLEMGRYIGAAEPESLNLGAGWWVIAPACRVTVVSAPIVCPRLSVSAEAALVAVAGGADVAGADDGRAVAAEVAGLATELTDIAGLTTGADVGGTVAAEVAGVAGIWLPGPVAGLPAAMRVSAGSLAAESGDTVVAG